MPLKADCPRGEGHHLRRGAPLGHWVAERASLGNSIGSHSPRGTPRLSVPAAYLHCTSARAVMVV